MILVLQNQPNTIIPPVFQLNVEVDMTTLECSLGGGNKKLKVQLGDGMQWSYQIRGNCNPHTILPLLQEVEGKFPNYRCPPISLEQYCKPFLPGTPLPPSPAASFAGEDSITYHQEVSMNTRPPLDGGNPMERREPIFMPHTPLALLEYPTVANRPSERGKGKENAGIINGPYEQLKNALEEIRGWNDSGEPQDREDIFDAAAALLRRVTVFFWAI
jgi:hypothetical protein